MVSAYLRQGTSYQCRDLDLDPYPDQDPNPWTDRYQNLIICSLAHCKPSLKISCKSVRTFLRKVDNRHTNRETDRQTKNKQRRLYILLGGGNKRNGMRSCYGNNRFGAGRANRICWWKDVSRSYKHSVINSGSHTCRGKLKNSLKRSKRGRCKTVAACT